MKKFFAIFAGILLAVLSQLALAAPAVVSTLTGTAQAIPGAGAPRALRIGDNVEQGETIATGDNSSLVLRFEDGQVVALTSRSRMAVNSYTYNQAEPAKSNVLLSLLNGSMRAVTGLIGKADPTKVSYRVRNATIGIRGTDVTFATDESGNIAVTVADGMINFTFNGKTVSIPKDQGATTTPTGEIQTASAAAIIAAVASANPSLAAALNRANSDEVRNAVQNAVTQSSQPQSPGSQPAPASITVPPKPPGSGTGTSGGGNPSPG